MFPPLLELEQTSATEFVAPRSPEKSDRMFGGQFIAQCIAAAIPTLDADRNIHSLHAYFLRPGDSSQPCQIKVENVRDGRSFSHRQMSAFQNGKELFRMFGSWSVEEESPDFNAHTMPDVPPPEKVNYSYYQFCQDQMPDKDYLATVKKRPMEILYINPPMNTGPIDELEDQLMWIRIVGELPDDSWRHDAGLAYISDSTIIDHIAVPHGLRWIDNDFDGTSLDHVMWFHRRCVATDWILFEQIVEWTDAGRGLAAGRLWSREGDLLATCGQEGLMRF